jgi:hypothetical protein
METGIFAAFSKKVISTIIAVGSMFYSTIDGVTPKMSITDIFFRNENLFVSTVIENCFTEELDQILASGNEIPINFDIELYKENAKLPDTTFSFHHTLHFSPLDKDFSVYLSEQNRYIHSLNFEEAKSLFTNFNQQSIISSDDLSDEINYFIKITAWLDKINMQGLEEELNLIYYWNSIKPNSNTPLFSKSNFQS